MTEGFDRSRVLNLLCKILGAALRLRWEFRCGVEGENPSNAILWFVSYLVWKFVKGTSWLDRKLPEVEKCGFMFTLFLMSTSAVVLCESVVIISNNRIRSSQLFRTRTFPSHHHHASSNSFVSFANGRKRFSGLIPNANKKYSNHGKRAWWQKFFLDEGWDWFGLKEDDMLEEPKVLVDGERASEEETFEAWKRRAEAISELREAQEDARNMESRAWEDWLVEEGTTATATIGGDDSSRGQDWEEGLEDRAGDIPLDPSETMPLPGMARRDLVFGNEDDDELLYEDRVFRYASLNSVSTSGAGLTSQICQCMFQLSSATANATSNF